jgi:hypothetical protein
MFISTRFLTEQLDVDADVAKFFVDRPVPADNRYWKDRLLYVARGTGFVFIPLVYDILLRLGVDKAALLEEPHVLRMEKILDSAGRVEFDGLSGSDHIEASRKAMEGKVRNAWLWQALIDYFAEGPHGPLGREIPPLNRADTFLFSVCDLSMDEPATRTFLTYWYALIGSFLMMDDVMDWEEDKKLGEENAILYLGEGPEAFAGALALLRADLHTLGTLNPSLEAHLEQNLEQLKK